MRALLDVNVLIALFDPDHAFHERSHVWWAANSPHGWASCPLTENGMVRIMSTSSYSPSARFTPGDLIDRLRQFVRQSDHAFWPDVISLRDDTVFAVERVHSSRLLTDFYLLGLATRQEGRLVTFDQGIPLSAVSGAKAENLWVI